MWRSFFIALGISSCLLGAECLVLDKATLAAKKPAAAQPLAGLGNPAAARPREIVPPEWAPWSLMSAGAVTMLYSFTIPRKGKE